MEVLNESDRIPLETGSENAVMKITCIIPANNEEGNIEKTVQTLASVLRHNNLAKNYEIIIVNDNSTDRTGDLADYLSNNNSSIKVIHIKGTPGFGNALKVGFKNATGDVLIPFMGDLSDDPKDIVKLIEKIEEGHDVVYGSRFIKGGRLEGYPFFKRISNRSFNNLVRLLLGVKETDVTNAFKAYRREVIEKIGIENIKSDNFDITLELPVKAQILGFSSVEVPVVWHGRIRGNSKLKLRMMGPLYIKRLISIFFLNRKS